MTGGYVQYQQRVVYYPQRDGLHGEEQQQHNHQEQHHPQKSGFNHRSPDNIQICMDISFIDHPYLIGPRGKKCQHLMDRFRSLIHFPDGNRHSTGPKINNVLVHGSMKSAEKIRAQLRERTPVRLVIQLDHFPNAEALARSMEMAIIERSLPMRLTIADDFRSANLKTEWRNEELLMNFCDEFLGYPNSLLGNPEIYVMAETLLALVNPWNPEMSLKLTDAIREKTGSHIFIPPGDSYVNHPPSHFIKGSSASGVLQAARCLLGLTMFQVSFLMPHTFHPSRHLLEEWRRDLLVHVAIQPIYQKSSDVPQEKATLSSFEFCLNNVYKVRSILLGINNAVQTSSYEFMATAQKLVPGNVFSTAQLFYPLHAIDSDEDIFDVSISDRDFFDYFYGGPPSSALHLSTPKRFNKMLTTRLQALMDISSNSSCVSG